MWRDRPLVPAFSQRFGLTKLEGGVLLASTSVAILLVSIPAGMLSERFGVRRLTLVSLAVMAQPISARDGRSFAALLGRVRCWARIRHPVDGGSGLAQRGVGDRHAQALSLTVTTAGSAVSRGLLCGRARAAVRSGRSFTVAAVGTLAVMVALMLDSSGSGGAVEAAQPLARPSAALSDHGVIVSVVLMSLGV
jgi:hypothetical protein